MLMVSNEVKERQKDRKGTEGKPIIVIYCIFGIEIVVKELGECIDFDTMLCEF